MEPSKLSDHKLKKGKFITPFYQITNCEELPEEKSWTYGRMPEYLWIGLLFHYYGRDEGLKKANQIITLLHKLAPKLNTAKMSEIMKLSDNIQRLFYDYIVNLGAQKALSPLTIFLTMSYAPVFAEMFYCVEDSIESRCSTLTDTMSKLMDHQSHESTDVRFIALYFSLLSGHLHIQKSQGELINAYPNLPHNDELMRKARPFVRAMEQSSVTFASQNTDYIDAFWRCVSEMTECSLYTVSFPNEDRDISEYMKNLHKIFTYLSDLYISAAPLDDKMIVLLGIATYSYKRLKEAYEHQLFNTISGRSCIRVLIEDYIMIKYLVINENAHANIYRDYQIYGLGLYKLVLERHRDAGHNDDCHFEDKYIELIVNEFKNEEFIDMDTKYFDNQVIRLKAEAVDEKLLYGLYYDYDSSFEHGLWGAIRESSLIKCNNPAHKYHCIPDIGDETVLKSVLPDCIMVMNKTVKYLSEIYGIPEQLINEVIHFEFKPTNG